MSMRHEQRTTSFPTCRARLRIALADERGSAAVEYVGLALVISALMGSLAGAVDSAMGERLAHAIVHRLLDRVGH